MKPASLFLNERRVPRLRAWAVVCLGGLLAALASFGPVVAQPQAPAAEVAKVYAGNGTRFVLPLSQLIGNDKPHRLSGVSSRMTVSLPMPSLWQAQDVRLELSGTASRALIALSQLEVSVNGRVVGQFALGDGQLTFRHQVEVPVQLLKDGFNEVQVSVAQHYTDKCEYEMAPQLWTDIDLAESRFVVIATPRSVPARLDLLDTLFDKAMLADTPVVSILTAAAPSGPVLTAAGLVAQGVGQRFDYVPVRLATGRFPADMAALSAALPAGARGAVVVGTFANLSSYLAGLGIPADSGPVVAVRQLRGDATRFVLVLAARVEADLPVAATAFAIQRMHWPDREWVAVRDLEMPLRGSITAAVSALKPSTEAFPLQALGYTSTTYTGLPAGSARLRFWNASWQGRVQVRVHASYGSGMAEQSALNVLVNNTTHGSIPFNNPQGGSYDNYTVSVPSGSLLLGWNTLELQPMLVPQTNGGECKAFFLGNLTATIYDDTTLQMFGGSPLSRPDLGLLAQDGRASQTARIGRGMAIQLTDVEDATVSAGLTLMAKIAQVVRGPMLHTNFLLGEDATATNRIWVGALARLPSGVRSLVGVGEGDSLALSVPLIRSVRTPVTGGSESLRALREAMQWLGPDTVTVSAQVTLDNALPQHAIAATIFDGEDRPLTVFTAATPALLQAGLHDVVGYGQWAQLRGGLSIWRPGSSVVQSRSAEDAPFSAYSLRGGMGLWVSQYPWWSLTILLLVVAGMVLLTRIVLANYRRRHLPPQLGQRSEDEEGP